MGPRDRGMITNMKIPASKERFIDAKITQAQAKPLPVALRLMRLYRRYLFARISRTRSATPDHSDFAVKRERM